MRPGRARGFSANRIVTLMARLAGRNGRRFRSKSHWRTTEVSDLSSAILSSWLITRSLHHHPNAQKQEHHCDLKNHKDSGDVVNLPAKDLELLIGHKPKVSNNLADCRASLRALWAGSSDSRRGCFSSGSMPRAKRTELMSING